MSDENDTVFEQVVSATEGFVSVISSELDRIANALERLALKETNEP